MATTTTNFGLTKPGTADNADITVIDTDLDQIDTQMKTNADAAASAQTTANTAKSNLTTHEADMNNPHQVTSAQAGAVANAGSAVSIAIGTAANKPTAGTAGRIYIETDTARIMRDDGAAWQVAGVVNWTDVTNKPTTIAGYGITDPIALTTGFTNTGTITGGTVNPTTLQRAGHNVAVVDQDNAFSVAQTRAGNTMWDNGSLPITSLTNEDLDTITLSGFYRLNIGHANEPIGVGYGQLLVVHGGGDTILQIASDYAGTYLWYRNGNPSNIGGAGAWSAWKRIAQPDIDNAFSVDQSFNGKIKFPTGYFDTNGNHWANAGAAAGTSIGWLDTNGFEVVTIYTDGSKHVVIPNGIDTANNGQYIQFKQVGNVPQMQVNGGGYKPVGGYTSSRKGSYNLLNGTTGTILSLSGAGQLEAFKYMAVSTGSGTATFDVTIDGVLYGSFSISPSVTNFYYVNTFLESVVDGSSSQYFLNLMLNFESSLVIACSANSSNQNFNIYYSYCSA